LFPSHDLLAKESSVTEVTDKQADTVTPVTVDPAKDNAYELSKAIPNLLDLHNGREWNVAHMLSGTSKKSGYKEYTTYFVGDNMVSPVELSQVVAYYKKECKDASLLQSPEKIADWVGKYRNQAQNAQKTQADLQEILRRTRNTANEAPQIGMES
jgi:hypothetical protein